MRNETKLIMFKSIATTSTTTLLLKVSLLLCCSASIINYASAFSSSSPFVALEAAGGKCGTSSISTTTTSITTTSRERVVLSAYATSSGKRIDSKKDIEILLGKNRRVVNSLASVVGSKNKDGEDDVVSEVTRLRFAMAFETGWEAKIALKDAIEYREKGKGKAIVDAAFNAFTIATSGENGKWDNDIVRDSAPHASRINKYITPKNIISLSTADGDLLYVIRASLINDKKMMNEVTVDQLSEFFMYVKEIHNLVANQRSEQTGRLCEVIFANDITGVRKPPDSRFSKALSSSSAQYEKLYPTLAGPTLITNLPFILQAFVSFFKPLFPKSVQKKLKFIRAPVLGSFRDLTPLADYNGSQKKSFLAEIDKLVKK